MAGPLVPRPVRSARAPTGDAVASSDTPDRARRRRVPISTVRARISGTRSQLEAQRPTNRVIDSLFRTLQLLNESGGGLLAGAIAFRFFLFLVPCVFVLVMGLGLGADAAGADLHDVARQAGIAGVAASAIESGAAAPTVTRWVTFAVAVVALLTGSRNLLKALWVTHALIWKVPLQKLRHPTRAVFAFIGVFMAAIVLIRLAHAMRGLSFVAWVLGLALYTLVPASVWLVCSSRLFPACPGVTWRNVLPGAIAFGAGTQVLHLVTVFWVARSMAAKSAAYGAIGAALTILVWAYLLGLLVTSAAALNAALWHSPAPDARPAEMQPAAAATGDAERPGGADPPHGFTQTG